MTDILLLTVPHTGTMWALGVLRAAGARVLVQVHALPSEVGKIPRLIKEDYAVVSTMRHPLRTAESWLMRGTPWRHGGHDPAGDPSVVDSFHTLMALTDRKTLFLPVDTDDREARLRHAGKVLGLALETDWTPVNASLSAERAVVPPPAHSRVAELVRDPFFAQFGY